MPAAARADREREIALSDSFHGNVRGSPNSGRNPVAIEFLRITGPCTRDSHVVSLAAALSRALSHTDHRV